MNVDALTISLGLGLLIPFLTAAVSKSHDKTVQSLVSFALATLTGVLAYTQGLGGGGGIDWKQLGIATVLAGVSAAGVRKSWLDQAVQFVNHASPGFIGRDAMTIYAKESAKQVPQTGGVTGDAVSDALGAPDVAPPVTLGVDPNDTTPLPPPPESAQS